MPATGGARRRLAALAAAAVVASGAATSVGSRAARVAAVPFSHDGEATIDVAGAFREPFALTYDATLRAQPANRSWSTLEVSLLGGPPPSDSVAVGLYPTGGTVHAFTFVARGRVSAFRDVGVVCARGCRLTLAGDAATIRAAVNDRVVARWPRFGIHLSAPTVQLNGEVDAVGDRIAGKLVPIALRAGGVPLGPPLCAFSTRGITVRRTAGGAFAFDGAHVASAPAYFSSPADGRTGDTCAAVR